MTVYYPKRAVDEALREAIAEARQKGFREGLAEAKSILAGSARLNGAAHVALKALGGEDDTGILSRETDRGNSRISGDDSVRPMGGQSVEPSEALTLAIIDALSEAKLHYPDSDGGEVVKYLESLLDDPEALAEAMGEKGEPTSDSPSEESVQNKAFDENKHPRGDDGRFISREAIHAAKNDPSKADALRAKVTDPDQRKKLEAALGGEVDLGRTKAGLHRERVAQSKAVKAEAVQRSRELANDISTARRGGEPVTSEHYKELAKYLPHLSIQELRSVRGKLAASFGGSTRRDEMVSKLLAHAKNKALLEATNEKHAEDDPLDFGVLTDYQSEGNAKGPGENPNPPEQHGGRMQQRHELMANLPEGSKTSHGTPDTGSVLKQGERKIGDKPGIGKDRTQPDPVESQERTAQDEYRDEVKAESEKPSETRSLPAGDAALNRTIGTLKSHYKKKGKPIPPAIVWKEGSSDPIGGIKRAGTRGEWRIDEQGNQYGPTPEKLKGKEWYKIEFDANGKPTVTESSP